MTEPLADKLGFQGLRVASFESRRGQEMSRLITERGGQPMIAASMQEVPLAQNKEVLLFGEKLLEGAVDVVIFLTGTGAETLFEILETRYSPTALMTAFSRTLRIARGPKPHAALRTKGLTSTLVKEPATWREVLAALDGEVDIRDKTVAVQEYGTSNEELIQALVQRGARVLRVPVYRWALPDNRGPLREALRAVIDGEIDVVLFTNAHQIQHVLQLAQEEGVESEFRQALGRAVIASVGPICTQFLDEYGLPVDIEPEKPRMGELVDKASERSPSLLREKRQRTDGETEGRRDGELGRDGDGETERQRDGELGRDGDGETERQRDGEKQHVEDSTHQSTFDILISPSPRHPVSPSPFISPSPRHPVSPSPFISPSPRHPVSPSPFISPSPRHPVSPSPFISPSLDGPFMKACRREPTPFTPIWLMRQAGRYMKEYRDLRERHSFLDLCKDSDLSTEVSVYAVQRLGVDAAILFSDILLILEPMGLSLEYAKGDGPVIHNPVRTAADVDRLRTVEDPEALPFVTQAIQKTRRALPMDMPLIGFAGAPFTLASYAIEGMGSRNYIQTKSFMYHEPEAWRRLLEKLSDGLIVYLNSQVDAGAQAVQLFDSWVGCLSPEDYRHYVLPHTRRVIQGLRPGIPVIHFGTGTGTFLELLKEAGGNVIGLDWRVELDEGWRRLGEVAIQGNLDPVILFAALPEIRRQAERILKQAAGRPGHIFNLGHGILPNTPVGHVKALVDFVHELSARRILS